MKLSKTLAIPLVGILLVAAAGAVMATSGAPTAPAVNAPAAATPTPSPTPTPKPTKSTVKDTELTGVLDDLVAKGTITAAQKTAILDGLAAERTARLKAREDARKQAQADRKQLKDFLADGVITKDEFDKLPANSPLRKLTTMMDDGKITTDELRGLGLGGKLGGGRGGHGFGGFKFFGPGAAPTPSPTTGTSG